MKIPKLAFSVSFAAAAIAAYADPSVSDVSLADDGDGDVTVTYTLSGAPAIVTMDIETDDLGEWESIGGAHVRNVSADSAVFRRIDADGTHTVKWRASLDWPGNAVDGGVRARVTAWPLSNPPDYMVVDISSNAVASTEKRFYPGVDFLPGGILDNPDYRTSKLVMRKIMADGVTWWMGSDPESNEKAVRNAVKEALHQVTLSGNYYAGVFPVTQTQCVLVTGSNPSKFTNSAYRSLRPVEGLSYNMARLCDFGVNTANSAYYPPADPHPTSFIGRLRTKTGIKFDLPGEAQWEFACRAGHGSGYSGDGTILSTPNLPGRFTGKGGYPVAGDENYGNANTNAWTAANGTAECGSYAPNSWGLYDMQGNVTEWCLDWYAEDITGLGGAVNTEVSQYRSVRGGAWEMSYSSVRPSNRDLSGPASATWRRGVRVFCPASME